MILDWSANGQLLAPGLFPVESGFGMAQVVTTAFGRVDTALGARSPGIALGARSPGVVLGPRLPGVTLGPRGPGADTGPEV